MKKIIIVSILSLAFISCSSSSKKEENLKAEKVNTQLENMVTLDEKTQVAVNQDGNVVTQEKTQMIEHLHQLEYGVKKEYDDLYGNPNYNSHGMYGKLEDCKMELNSKELGGEGTYVQMPDHTTDVTNIFEIEKTKFDKIGIDEKGALVGLNEEGLKKRTDRFNTYREQLRKRRVELEKDLKICQAKVKAKKWDKKNEKKESQGE